MTRLVGINDVALEVANDEGDLERGGTPQRRHHAS